MSTDSTRREEALDEANVEGDALHADDAAVEGANDKQNMSDLAAKALVSKAYRLGDLGRTDEAVEIYDNVVLVFGENRSEASRLQVALALKGKGAILERLARYTEAVAV